MMLHIPPDFDKAKIHGVSEDLYVLKCLQLSSKVFDIEKAKLY